MGEQNIAVPGNKKPPDTITERLPEVFDKGTFKSTKLTLAEIEFKRYGVKPLVPRCGTKTDEGGKDTNHTKTFLTTDEHGWTRIKPQLVAPKPRRRRKNAKKQMQGMGLTQFSPVQDQFWFSGCAG